MCFVRSVFVSFVRPSFGLYSLLCSFFGSFVCFAYFRSFLCVPLLEQAGFTGRFNLRFDAKLRRGGMYFAAGFRRSLFCEARRVLIVILKRVWKRP